MVGVDKPQGISSHDVVDRARRVFDERRVGHTGTLDPLATGVLVLCVGPATRLAPYLQSHDKRYRFTVVFGSSTDTDDAAGKVVQTGEAPEEVCDPLFAQGFVERLVGTHQQRPPAYSAIQVDGQRAYKAARAGKAIDLAPREVEVYEASLLGVDAGMPGSSPSWDIAVHVSKGTYIRSLTRDIGEALGCPSHVGELARTSLGPLPLEACVSLPDLEGLKEKAALDPVALLGCRMVMVEGSDKAGAQNGKALPAGAFVVRDCPQMPPYAARPAPQAPPEAGHKALLPGELIAVATEDSLIGLFRYDRPAQALKAECVFAGGIARG